MSFVCLWTPHWPIDAGTSREELPALLLTIAPHVLVAARDLLWVDARGMPVSRLAVQVFDAARRHGVPSPRVGAAATVIAAEVAARHTEGSLTVVGPGDDVQFLAPLPLAVLAPPVRLATMLADVGLLRCGELARLPREAIEVRFGADGVALWRLARAEDPRRIFSPVPRALPAASLAWADYALQDPERLLFTINRLMASVCAELGARGDGARAMTLGLALANQAAVEHPLRTARPTASRTVWMRRVRAAFEHLQVPDAVTGLSLRVDAVGATGVAQGDVFDRGFPTAGALDDALCRLAEDHAGVVCEPVVSAHVLPERRMRWVARAPHARTPAQQAGAGRAGAQAFSRGPCLVLQVLPAPSRLDVTTGERRGHRVPLRFRVHAPAPAIFSPASHAMDLVTVVGPDQVSGDLDAATPYVREYFHGLTAHGILVLLFRDVRTETWYLQGWWD